MVQLTEALQEVIYRCLPIPNPLLMLARSKNIKCESTCNNSRRVLLIVGMDTGIEEREKKPKDDVNDKGRAPTYKRQVLVGRLSCSGRDLQSLTHSSTTLYTYLLRLHFRVSHVPPLLHRRHTKTNTHPLFTSQSTAPSPEKTGMPGGPTPCAVVATPPSESCMPWANSAIVWKDTVAIAPPTLVALMRSSCSLTFANNAYRSTANRKQGESVTENMEGPEAPHSACIVNNSQRANNGM